MAWRFDCRPLVGVLAAAVLCLSAADAGALEGTGGGGLRLEGAALLAQADAIDRQVSGAARDALRRVRQAWNSALWMFGEAAEWWGYWLRRGAFSIGVAVVAALADTGLLNALRTGGLRALIGYVPLMLYVYGRLLFSSGVNLVPKLLLLGTLAYGAVRGDLLPDRRPYGRVEDVILIVIATRAFIAACPERLVNRFAERAIGWRHRVARIQQRSR